MQREVKNMMHPLLQKLQNQYDDLDDNLKGGLLLKLAQMRLECCPPEEQAILSDVPVILTYAMKDFNACAGSIGTNDRFVVLECGLPAFFDLFRSLFLEDILLPQPDQDVTPEKAQKVVDTAIWLIGGDGGPMHSWLGAKSSAPGQSKIKDKFVTFAFHELFMASLMAWFIGHEYGHIVLGHLPKTRSVTLRSVDETVDLNTHEPDLEYEADAYGLQFVTRDLADAKWSTKSRLKEDAIDSIYLKAAPEVCLVFIRLFEYLQQCRDHYISECFTDMYGDRFGLKVAHYLKAQISTHPRARLRHERVQQLGLCDEDKNPSSHAISHNTEAAVMRIMQMIHEKKVTMDMKPFLLHALDTLPDELMAQAIDFD